MRARQQVEARAALIGEDEVVDLMVQHPRDFPANPGSTRLVLNHLMLEPTTTMNLVSLTGLDEADVRAALGWLKAQGIAQTAVYTSRRGKRWTGWSLVPQE